MILKFEAAVPQMVEIERELSFYFTLLISYANRFSAKNNRRGSNRARADAVPLLFSNVSARQNASRPRGASFILLTGRLFSLPHRLQHTKKASEPFPDALRFYFALQHPLFFGSRIRTVRSQRGGIRNAVRRAFVVRTGRRGLSLLRFSRIFGNRSGI